MNRGNFLCLGDVCIGADISSGDMWLRLAGNVQQMWSAVKSAIKIEHYSGPERIKIEQGQLHQLLSPPHSRCHRVLQVLAKNSEKQLPALREVHSSFIGLTFVTSIPLRWVISICVWWLLCEVRLWFGLEGYAATRPGGWGSGHRLWPKNVLWHFPFLCKYANTNTKHTATKFKL